MFSTGRKRGRGKSKVGNEDEEESPVRAGATSMALDDQKPSISDDDVVEESDFVDDVESEEKGDKLNNYDVSDRRARDHGKRVLKSNEEGDEDEGEDRDKDDGQMKRGSKEDRRKGQDSTRDTGKKRGHPLGRGRGRGRGRGGNRSNHDSADETPSLEGYAVFRPSDATLTTNYNHPYDWMHPGTPLRTQNASVQEAINSIDRELQSGMFCMDKMSCINCQEPVGAESTNTFELDGYCESCYLDVKGENPPRRASKELLVARRMELEEHPLSYQINYSEQPRTCYWCGEPVEMFREERAKKLEQRSRIDINGQPMPSVPFHDHNQARICLSCAADLGELLQLKRRFQRLYALSADFVDPQCANCGVRESVQFQPAMDRMGKLCVPCHAYKSVHGIEREVCPIAPSRSDEFIGAVCENTDVSGGIGGIRWDRVASDPSVNPGFGYSIEGIHTRWYSQFKPADSPPYQTFMLLQRNHLAKRDDNFQMYFCTARHPAQAALYFARFVKLYKNRPSTYLYIRQVEAWNIPKTKGDEWEDHSLGLMSFDELRRRIRNYVINNTYECQQRRKDDEARRLQKIHEDAEHQKMRAEKVVDHVKRLVPNGAGKANGDVIRREGTDHLTHEMNRKLYTRWVVRKRFELGINNMHLWQHLLWDKEEQARELYRYHFEHLYFGHEKLYEQLNHELRHLIRRPYKIPDMQQVVMELYKLLERQEFLSEDLDWLAKARSRVQYGTLQPFRQHFDRWTPREARDLPQWAQVRRRKVDLLEEADERVRAVIEKKDAFVNAAKVAPLVQLLKLNKKYNLREPSPEPTYETLADGIQDVPQPDHKQATNEFAWYMRRLKQLGLSGNEEDNSILRPATIQQVFERRPFSESKHAHRMQYLHQIQEWDDAVAAGRPRLPAGVGVATACGSSAQQGSSSPLSAMRQPLPDAYDMTPTPLGNYPIHLLPAEYQVHVYEAILEAETRKVSVRVLRTERYKRQGDSIQGGGPVRVPRTIHVENMRGFYRDMDRADGDGVHSDLLEDRMIQKPARDMRGAYETAEVVMRAYQPPPVVSHEEDMQDPSLSLAREYRARTGVEIHYRIKKGKAKDIYDHVNPDPHPNKEAMARVANRVAGRRGVGFTGRLPGTPGARPTESDAEREGDDEDDVGAEEEEDDEEANDRVDTPMSANDRLQRRLARFQQRQTVEELEAPDAKDAIEQVQFIRHMRALRRWQRERVDQAERTARTPEAAAQHTGRIKRIVLGDFSDDEMASEDNDEEDDDVPEYPVDRDEYSDQDIREATALEDVEEGGDTEEEELVLHRRGRKRTIGSTPASSSASSSSPVRSSLSKRARQ